MHCLRSINNVTNDTGALGSTGSWFLQKGPDFCLSGGVSGSLRTGIRQAELPPPKVQQLWVRPQEIVKFRKTRLCCVFGLPCPSRVCGPMLPNVFRGWRSHPHVCSPISSAPPGAVNPLSQAGSGGLQQGPFLPFQAAISSPHLLLPRLDIAELKFPEGWSSSGHPKSGSSPHPAITASPLHTAPAPCDNTSPHPPQHLSHLGQPEGVNQGPPELKAGVSTA